LFVFSLIACGLPSSDGSQASESALRHDGGHRQRGHHELHLGRDGGDDANEANEHADGGRHEDADEDGGDLDGDEDRDGGDHHGGDDGDEHRDGGDHSGPH
jgi:hypothetical protein